MSLGRGTEVVAALWCRLKAADLAVVCRVQAAGVQARVARGRARDPDAEARRVHLLHARAALLQGQGHSVETAPALWPLRPIGPPYFSRGPRACLLVQGVRAHPRAQPRAARRPQEASCGPSPSQRATHQGLTASRPQRFLGDSSEIPRRFLPPSTTGVRVQPKPSLNDASAGGGGAGGSSSGGAGSGSRAGGGEPKPNGGGEGEAVDLGDPDDATVDGDMCARRPPHSAPRTARPAQRAPCGPRTARPVRRAWPLHATASACTARCTPPP